MLFNCLFSFFLFTFNSLITNNHFTSIELELQTKTEPKIETGAIMRPDFLGQVRKNRNPRVQTPLHCRAEPPQRAPSCGYRCCRRPAQPISDLPPATRRQLARASVRAHALFVSRKLMKSKLYCNTARTLRQNAYKHSA